MGHGTAFLSHPNKLREAAISNFMYLFIALIREEQSCDTYLFQIYRTGLQV